MSLPPGDRAGESVPTPPTEPASDADDRAAGRRATVKRAVGGALIALAWILFFEITTSGVDDLAVGDCIDHPVAGDAVDVDAVAAEVSEVDTVSCAEPHDLEVFARAELPHGPDAAFPPPEAVDTAIVDTCRPHFERYVGLPFERSRLWITGFYPVESQWRTGDRAVICLLFDGDLRKLEGSMAGQRL